jgi:hypothetical protein
MIMADALPGIKRFFMAVGLKPWIEGYRICFIAGFIAQLGRMSASQAAQVMRRGTPAGRGSGLGPLGQVDAYAQRPAEAEKAPARPLEYRHTAKKAG